MKYNEDTRVKIPALVHFTRLEYEYLSLKNKELEFDRETNIHIPTFHSSLNAINDEEISIDETKSLINKIKATLSSDLGIDFYNAIIKNLEGKKLVDFSQNDKNTYQVVTELSCIHNGDEFRPDITILINGIPLAFVEVKKPHNKNGVQAEDKRMDYRLSNKNFRSFLNMFQVMVFSNNLPYSDEANIPFQGAFYATTAEKTLFLNRFKEERNDELHITPINEQIQDFIFKDTNSPLLKNSPEYKTNISPNTPTNSIITSLFSKERFKMLLRYGIAYVSKTLDTGATKLEKHIMRYPQFFATLAIRDMLENGGKKGIIWHTQGSGKTALAYYNTHFLKDYFQAKGQITQFFFIVDRLDLANQSADEFRSRGLEVKLIGSKDEFIECIKSTSQSSSGKDSIVVVNIHKFSQDSIAKLPDYGINIQRIFFIDEAHRSYNPSGSFLANLFTADPNSIKIALTGTPLIGAVYDENGNRISAKYDSKAIFGNYIHKYYYNQSIADHYTLRLIREDILTTYKESLRATLQELEVQQGAIDTKLILSHPSYVKKLVAYITEDFKAHRFQGDIGGMIVCASSEQAKAIYEEMKTNEFSSALILSDNSTGTNEEKKQWQNAFKKGEIDFLIVYNMLLTGFDAPRLKRLYLGRVIKDHSLLQTLTRVNRPYKDFRFGYIIDFADIKKEFDKTNQAYFNELQAELGDAFEEYRSIFKTQEEIQKDLANIKEVLFGFNVKNAEEFSKELATIDDKQELQTIRRALQLYQELHNIAKLHEYEGLSNLFDLEKIHHLLSIANAQLQALRDKEILQNAQDMDAILSLALEDVKFDFKKIDEHELAIADKFREQLIKAQRELAKTQDIKDPKFLTLKEELQRILSKKNIEELTSSEIEENTIKLLELYNSIQALNESNQRIANQYEGDNKFMRIHKQIHSQLNFANTQINHFLLEVKHQVDDTLLNNEATIENEGFFEEEIKEIIGDVNNLGLKPKQWSEIATLIASEYQNERKFL